MKGADIKLGRLFSKGKNAVVVAADHGEFDGPQAGMYNLPQIFKQMSMADGILLSPGMLPACYESFNYKGAPVPIMRINWSTTYCFQWEYKEARTAIAVSVADAVRLGADIVLISLTLKTGDEKIDAKNIDIFCKLANEAKIMGIPVIGEAFPTRHNELTPDELFSQVNITCRILAELGADAIKTFYTKDFKKVVKGCPLPILVLGAEKTPKESDALNLAKRAMNDGAKGVVFGRNVMQAKNLSKFLEKLCRVVKK